MIARVSFIVFFVFTLCSGHAQECTLDLGGKNAETIIRIFQLNDSQITKMETLQADLEVKTKIVEDEIEKLLSEHPQSKEADLITLGDKYKVLQQKIVDACWESDKMLLSTFNVRQYERYLILCKEAFRRPISVVPMTYEEDNDPK
ncbi:MAG: hypothetical protein HKN31_13830 [Pricia sp.]|nr:hypothetical protein [Pricia sp.]